MIKLYARIHAIVLVRRTADHNKMSTEIFLTIGMTGPQTHILSYTDISSELPYFLPAENSFTFSFSTVVHFRFGSFFYECQQLQFTTVIEELLDSVMPVSPRKSSLTHADTFKSRFEHLLTFFGIIISRDISPYLQSVHTIVNHHFCLMCLG